MCTVSNFLCGVTKNCKVFYEIFNSPECFDETVYKFGFFLLCKWQSSIIDIGQLDSRHQLLAQFFFQTDEEIIIILHFLCGVDKQGADYVGAVGLVAGTQAADDSTEVKVVLVWSGTELEAVVAPGLDDGRVAHVY